jgi:hypothetical protein
MYRAHYQPPERLPPHPQDYPDRNDAGEALGASGSRELLFLVLFYLAAIFVGILVLGALTPTSMSTNTAAIGGTSNR